MNWYKNNKYEIRKLLCHVMIFSLLLTITFTAINVRAMANTQQDTNSILRIFYFRDNIKARISLFTHPSSIDVLAPQTYAIDSLGMLEGSIDPSILAFTQRNNIKVMPLVTNKSFDNSTAYTILNDQTKQDIAINALITEAEKQKYWGWQIDFEGMNASYKDKYSAFINRVGVALKEHNLTFSVAVIAQISSNPTDYPNDRWNNLIGVYDYSALASSADFISVMSYDDPESTGPVAPNPWLQQVIDYSLKFIPANKLSLGIPLYYWGWNNTSKKLVAIGGYTGIQKILKKSHTVGYSLVNQVPFVKYTIRKSHYEIWYENQKSLSEKINLIKKYNLQGFSAWALGLEDPNIYSVKNF